MRTKNRHYLSLSGMMENRNYTVEHYGASKKATLTLIQSAGFFSSTSTKTE